MPGIETDLKDRNFGIFSTSIVQEFANPYNNDDGVVFCTANGNVDMDGLSGQDAGGACIG